jgi:acetyl esterase/lipase
MQGRKGPRSEIGVAVLVVLVSSVGQASAQAQDEQARLRERSAQLAANLPPEAQPHEKLVYRTTDQGKPLSIWVYWPGGKRPQQPLPGIVLYHGGGWTTGTPVFYLAVARHFVGLYQGPRNAASFELAMKRADAFLTRLGLIPAQ